MTYQEKILKMRNENNSYVLTLLQEVISWNPFLDEIVCLCEVCSILDKHNLAVSRNEVKKAFNKYYSKEFHGDKISYLNWIYKNFRIKSKTKVFTSQVRKNNPLPQFLDPISAPSLLENKRGGVGMGQTSTYSNLEVKQ